MSNNENFNLLDAALDDLSSQYEHENGVMAGFFVDGHLPETRSYEEKVNLQIDNLIYKGRGANREVNQKKAAELMKYLDARYNESASKDSPVVDYIPGAGNHTRFFYDAKAIGYAARYLKAKKNERER